MARQPPPEGGAVVQENDEGQAVLLATQAFSYGEPILREEPLLLVPANASEFLRSAGSDAMVKAAATLGDASRLAAFAAFSRLPEEEKEVLLAMGVSPGSTAIQDNMNVVGAFTKDFPEFADAVDWPVFARVAAIVGERGTRLPGGERALYRRSDRCTHSCSPNAVVETLGDKGLRELRTSAYEGIAENEEITVSFVTEEVMFLPRGERRDTIKKMRPRSCACACTRCAAGDDATPAMDLFKGVASGPGGGPKEAQVRARLEALARLDALLPCALVGKARLRAKLGQAFETAALAAAEEGQAAEAPRAMLDEAVRLYEVCLEETAVALGQKGLMNLDSVTRRLKKVKDTLT